MLSIATYHSPECRPYIGLSLVITWLATFTHKQPTMSTPPPPHVIEDCSSFRLFSDGSVVRNPDPFFYPAIHDSSIEWTDLPFGPPHFSLHLRLYRPKTLISSKLPVLFYFHGGGFCLGSRTWSNFHDCGLRLSSSLSAIIVSPDYRLAPEHRLPAAIHDAISALEWLDPSDPPHPWLSQSADLSRVFVSGESAGANLVHHLALHCSRSDPGRTRFKRFILLMPFFSGVDRTGSEATCSSDAFLTLERADQFWRLALPRGATRDDPMGNPFGPGGPELGAMELGPMMVVVGERDMLRDRGVEYAERLKEMGKKVELVELKGKEHGFFAMNSWSDDAGDLVRLIGRFIEDNQS
ncbi:putative carboxylesterase [Dioscorea sansibarensis]